MSPDIAKAIHTFLGRATIQGNEVGTFVRCLQELERIVYVAEAAANAGPQEAYATQPMQAMQPAQVADPQSAGTWNSDEQAPEAVLARAINGTGAPTLRRPAGT